MAETEGRKMIKLGETEILIVDPHGVLPVSADIFTEMWTMNGVVHISFATIVKDGDAPGEAKIVSRIRLSLPTIADLANSFKEILAREMPGPERAN